MDKKDLKYLTLIFIIFIAACIETDIYLPAFPDMMAYFNVSEEAIQQLLTWNFFGVCISGPFYGPLSDSFGRKKPLMAALGLFFLGSVITLFAEGYTSMLIGRLLQGLGSGGCFTLGTAILFDAFQAEKAVQATNQLNMIAPLVMACAPVAGGYLNNAFGFRSNFLTIALFVLASLIICLWFFEETLPQERRAPLCGGKIARDFFSAMTCLPFWQVILVVSLIFAGYLTFLSATPVLFMIEFGVSKEIFPFYQAAILGAWLIASFTSKRALETWGNTKVKLIGSALIVTGGLTLALTALLLPQSPTCLTGAMILYAWGANWVQGLYFPEGMELLPDIKGVTSSILTSARLLITAAIVAVVSHYYDATVYPVVVAIVAIVAVIVGLIIAYERGCVGRPAVQSNTTISPH